MTWDGDVGMKGENIGGEGWFWKGGGLGVFSEDSLGDYILFDCAWVRK